MIERVLLALVVAAACKKTSAPPAEKGSQAVIVTIDAAPPPDAAPPDAPAIPGPTEAQALEAGLAWIVAAGDKQPEALLAASTLPFRLTDTYSAPSCGAVTLTDEVAFLKTARCLLRERWLLTIGHMDRKGDVRASLALPEPPDIIEPADAWNALVSDADRASHAFVTFSSRHPEYRADVLYALLSIRLVDGAPKVDGAVLVISSQGG